MHDNHPVTIKFNVFLGNLLLLLPTVAYKVRINNHQVLPTDTVFLMLWLHLQWVK